MVAFSHSPLTYCTLKARVRLCLRMSVSSSSLRVMPLWSLVSAPGLLSNTIMPCVRALMASSILSKKKNGNENQWSEAFVHLLLSSLRVRVNYRLTPGYKLDKFTERQKITLS